MDKHSETNIVPKTRIRNPINEYILGYPANPKKLSQKCIETFVSILYRLNVVMNKKTCLKFMYYDMDNEEIKKNILNAFSKLNKDAFNVIDYINICGVAKNKTDYLEFYNSIDVSLDGFPYSGHTTTIEALHMNTPVVTMKGNCYHSRGSYSILMNSGIPILEVNRFISDNVEDYITNACNLVIDRQYLYNVSDTNRYTTFIRDSKAGNSKTFSDEFCRCIQNEIFNL